MKLLLFLGLTLGSISAFANEEKARQCLDRELDLFEAQKGRLPTDDEASLIIDYCATPALEEKGEVKHEP